MCFFSSICVEFVNIKKQNNFEHVLYLLLIKSEEKKNYLKKWIVARRSQLNYQEK